MSVVWMRLPVFALLLSVLPVAVAGADNVVVVSASAHEPHRDAIVDALSVAGITAEANRAQGDEICRQLACLGDLARSLGTDHALRYIIEVGGSRGDQLHVWLVDQAGLSGDARVAFEFEAGGPARVVPQAYREALMALKLGGHGLVRIRSRPVGASIRVDGKAAGHTPLELHMQPGARRIVAELSGFAAIADTVDVQRGRVVELELALQRRVPDAPGRDSASGLNHVVAGVLVAASLPALVLAGRTLLDGGPCEARDGRGVCTRRDGFDFGDAALLVGGVVGLGVGTYFLFGVPIRAQAGGSSQGARLQVVGRF